MKYPKHTLKYSSVAFICLVAAFLVISSLSARDKNAIFYNKQGWERLKKADAPGAIFSFKIALQKNAKYKEALLGLGNAYLEVEAFEQSYDLFSRVLKIDRKSVAAHVGLGKTLTAMGNYSGALQNFNDALKISGESLEAKYGTARLYYNMGRIIWAKRSLKNVFRIDPYHIDSLLLMADIKSTENRLDEARTYVEKAIDADSDSPLGYIKFGEILLRQYLVREDDDSLEEARDALANALSIQPKSFNANRIMGFIALISGSYGTAADYFSRALKDVQSDTVRYSLAVAYDMSDNRDGALKEFLQTFKSTSMDSILRSRLENFLVFRDYKIGHPARVMLNKEQHSLATASSKKNLPDQTVMYLRRTLLLNPMNINAREELMDHYRVRGYHRFFIDEMKDLLRFFPERKYQERLNVEIIKRRDFLYHLEGYSSEMPPRDVPVVLVMDFHSGGGITSHPDAGNVISSYLSFVLGQFGRMKPVGIRKRRSLSCGFKCSVGHLEENLTRIEEQIKSGELGPVDYIVYGTFMENSGYISLDCKLMDYKKGYNIGEFSLTETGRESLPGIALRSARRIYSMIPFKGRVLKLKETGIVVNLGLFDGVEKGTRLGVYKFNGKRNQGDKLKKRMIFTVKEANAVISFAEANRKSDLEFVDSSDTVYPLKKRRAKKID